MFKELRNLKKDYTTIPKSDIFNLIRQSRKKIEQSKNPKQISEFLNILSEILEFFGKNDDINSERAILNQIVEIVWWNKENSDFLAVLVKGILTLLKQNQKYLGENRLDVFHDFIDILTRFQDNKTIFDTISRASIELIKWGSDKEILSILDFMKEKIVLYPLVDTIQILDAKIYMNALFYLDEQNCDSIYTIYKDFSCFSISNYQDVKIKQDGECKVTGLLMGEDINEILQEGAINAIINIARYNQKNNNQKNNCIERIREIIIDSEYLLKKDENLFFKDVFRLSYTFDIYDLWNDFIDLPIIKELQIEKNKNQTYETAEAKLLAIIKNLRIEEYDALKVGRRGIKLAYDFNDFEDISKLLDEMIDSYKNSSGLISLVEEVDAVIEIDEDLREHLRESGQIPIDRKTVDELQDITTKEDDLKQAATNEKNIVEQLEFLQRLELNDDRYLMNQMMYAKALIFAVGMYGFASPMLNISNDDIDNQINDLTEKLMVKELIDPLVRAVTLRSARLDGKASYHLFKLLNDIGMKFLTKYYKQYNFIENIVRLISYLGRIGEVELLYKIKSELEKANRISLGEDIIPHKIARAINEGILVFTPEKEFQKGYLIDLLYEISKINSYDIYLQEKYIEGLSFNIFYLGYHNWKETENYINKLIDFSRLYSKNQQIIEKASLGILWATVSAKYNNQQNKASEYQKELEKISTSFPNSPYIEKMKLLSEKVNT
ncbi:MAG: hypothetical protein ACFFDW_10760 [Candidatus Thorarchaeota archaeon]